MSELPITSAAGPDGAPNRNGPPVVVPAGHPFRVGVTPDLLDLLRPEGTHDASGGSAPRGLDPFLRIPGLRWEPVRHPAARPAAAGAPPELEPAQVAGYDALLVLSARVTAATLEGADRLAIIARFGVGYDTVDVEACTRQGVLLTITPDGVRRPVASAAVAFILALSHRLPLRDRLTRAGRWEQRHACAGTGLTGRTLGVVGLGNIGRELVRLIEPFGMRHLAYDPYADPQQARSNGVALVELDHVLREGRLQGAALDVFEREPIDPADPLLALENVIVSPHAICWTDECIRGILQSAGESIAGVAAGSVPRHVVNPEALRHPRLAQTLHRNRERAASRP